MTEKEEKQSEPQTEPQTEQQPAAPEQPQIDDKQSRTWAMVCHLSALAGYTCIPLANVIAPLIVWFLKKDEFPAVNEHGKEAINFQISILIYTIVSIFLFVVVIGIFLLPVVLVTNLVLIIVAAVKANEGQLYKYPLCIRFIK